MFKRKSSLKRILVTNIGLIAIIGFVFICAFLPFNLSLLTHGPVMKGNTHGNNVALQIAVDDSSDVAAYMDILDTFGIRGTFFFPEKFYTENRDILRQVMGRGDGIGYYMCKDNESQRLALYIGCGVSVPVMSYIDGSNILQVCPSIDVSKLKETGDWQSILNDKLHGDMFVYTNADNNLDDFKIIVQIVLNKGYTILKMEEML